MGRFARLRKMPLRVAATFVGFWLLAPALIVIPLAFTNQTSFRFPPPGLSTRWFEAFFDDPRWKDSLWLSIRLGLVVTVISVVLGTFAALAFERSRFPGKSLLLSVLMAPMIMPIIVIAIAYYSYFLRRGAVGSFWSYVGAHTVLAFPFVLTTVRSALVTFDQRLELAAASLGASPVATFRLVTLPNISRGVASGALFAFITSFDEIVVSIFLASPRGTTLPVRMFNAVSRQLEPTVAAAATLILALTTLLLVVSLAIGNRNRPEEQTR